MGALGLVAVGTFIWGAIAGSWFDRASARRFVPAPDGVGGQFVVDSAHPALAWVSGSTFVVGLPLIVILRRTAAVWRRRTEAGRDAADRVWSTAWYCGRCGTVHIAGEQAVSPHELRTRVWGAGGYGDLARKHPGI